MMRRSRSVYYAILIVLAVLGLAAVWYRLAAGMKVTALTSYVSWGFWVALYIYFIGLSAGSFLLSTMIYVFRMQTLERLGRAALLTALGALAAGLLFIWVDLGKPYRFWEIFTRPHFTSVMTIESWLYLLYFALVAVELWLVMRDDLVRTAEGGPRLRTGLCRFLGFGYHPASDPAARARQQAQAARWVRLLGILGIPVAVGVHGGTGAIFAVTIARPYWNSGLFPIVFLVSALASGAGLMTLLYGIAGPRDRDYLPVLRSVAALTVMFLVLDLLLLASDVLVGLYGGVPAAVNVYGAMFRGTYWFVFWAGQLGLAGLVPFLIVAVVSAHPSGRASLWYSLAGLSTVLGILAVRFNIVIPGFVVPELSGLPAAYRSARLSYGYFPSVWEFATSIGIIALVVLVGSLLWERLPLFGAEAGVTVPETRPQSGGGVSGPSPIPVGRS